MKYENCSLMHGTKRCMRTTQGKRNRTGSMRCSAEEVLKIERKSWKEQGVLAKRASIHDTLYVDQKDCGHKRSYLGLIGEKRIRYSKKGH